MCDIADKKKMTTLNVNVNNRRRVCLIIAWIQLGKWIRRWIDFCFLSKVQSVENRRNLSWTANNGSSKLKCVMMTTTNKNADRLLIKKMKTFDEATRANRAYFESPEAFLLMYRWEKRWQYRTHNSREERDTKKKEKIYISHFTFRWPTADVDNCALLNFELLLLLFLFTPIDSQLTQDLYIPLHCSNFFFVAVFFISLVY